MNLIYSQPSADHDNLAVVAQNLFMNDIHSGLLAFYTGENRHGTAKRFVVGIRDQGEYAHSKGGVVYQGFGDRLCINKIDYEISGNGIPAVHHQSFDFSKIVLTEGIGEINPSHRDYAWKTTAKDENGNPLFPNGDYTITVRAYDSKDNVASASEIVRVENWTAFFTKIKLPRTINHKS